MLYLSILIWTLIHLTDAQNTFDMEYICGQEKSVFDFDIVLNGKASLRPGTMPTECIVTLEAGYTDSEYRLEVIIEAIDIKDCSVFLDIFNERQASGNYLRRLGCRSMSTDTIYSDKQWVTLRLSRPINLQATAYIFTLKVKAYRESDRALAGSDLPTGAIVGIILGLLALIIVAVILVWCWKSGRLLDYVGGSGDTEDLDEKSEKFGGSTASFGYDNKSEPWNTDYKNDPNVIRRTDGPQYLGRRSFRDVRATRNDNGSEYGDNMSQSSAQNGRLPGGHQSKQEELTRQRHEETLQKLPFEDGVEVKSRDGVASWQKEPTQSRNAVNAATSKGSDAAGQIVSTHNRISADIEKKGTAAHGWHKEQTSLKSLLNAEIRRRSSNSTQDSSAPRFRKETLIDDVFESDDNQVEAPKPQKSGHHSRSFQRGEGHDIKRPHKVDYSSSRRSDSISPNRRSRKDGSKSPERREGSNSPSRRNGEGFPTTDSLKRGTEGRDSNRSTSSQKENQSRAKTLAQEATEAKLKSRQSNQQDPPSDVDSNSFMSIPETATITAKVHPQDNNQHHVLNNKPHKDSEDLDSNDIEVREITHGQNDPETMANPNHSKSHKSPKSKKKKKKTDHRKRDEDILPPEAFEPLFDRPVSEEPYPKGMQPLNTAYPYGMQPVMYPMNYGMPFGMMQPQGSMPPGSQSYTYAYQNMPGPGMPSQQTSGQAAYFVQQSPSKNGPVQKTFMMATSESRPQSKSGYNQRDPGHPARSSTPHSVTSQDDGGSGYHRSHPKKSSALAPLGRLPQDTGQSHTATVMKSGFDPRTGIETNQVLWSDTTRDRTDPPPGTNPEVDRKTVTRTTTRGGYGNLPEKTDNITDHLYIQLEPDDPAFLSPSKTGSHALSSRETPEGDNVTHYLGLNYNHGSPYIIHPAPTRHKAIRDSVSIS